MKKSVRGFTLVELIVVIALISVLSVSAMVFIQVNSESADDSVRQNDIQTIEAALGSQSKIQGVSYADTSKNIVLSADDRKRIQDKNLLPPSASLNLHPIKEELAEFLSLTKEELQFYAVDDYNRVYFLGFPPDTEANDDSPVVIDDSVKVTSPPDITPRPVPPDPPPTPEITDPPNRKGPGDGEDVIEVPEPDNPYNPNGYFDWQAYVIARTTKNEEGGYYREAQAKEAGAGKSADSYDYFGDVNSLPSAHRPRGICFYEEYEGVGYLYIIYQSGTGIPFSKLADSDGNVKSSVQYLFNCWEDLGPKIYQIEASKLNPQDCEPSTNAGYYGAWSDYIDPFTIVYDAASERYYLYIGSRSNNPGTYTSVGNNWLMIDATNVPDLSAVK